MVFILKNLLLVLILDLKFLHDKLFTKKLIVNMNNIEKIASGKFILNYFLVYYLKSSSLLKLLII